METPWGTSYIVPVNICSMGHWWILLLFSSVSFIWRHY